MKKGSSTDYKFTITTGLTGMGFKQHLDFMGEMSTKVVDVLAHQADEAFRAKLIELGWTPPPTEPVSSLYFQQIGHPKLEGVSRVSVLLGPIEDKGGPDEASFERWWLQNKRPGWSRHMPEYRAAQAAWTAARRAALAAAAPPALTQPVGKEYWATQYPGKMPTLFGQRWIAELNWYPHEGEGHALVRLVEAERIEPDDFLTQPAPSNGEEA